MVLFKYLFSIPNQINPTWTKIWSWVSRHASFLSVMNNSNNKNKWANTYARHCVKHLQAPSHSIPKKPKTTKKVRFFIIPYSPMRISQLREHHWLIPSHITRKQKEAKPGSLTLDSRVQYTTSIQSITQQFKADFIYPQPLSMLNTLSTAIWMLFNRHLITHNMFPQKYDLPRK